MPHAVAEPGVFLLQLGVAFFQGFEPLQDVIGRLRRCRTASHQNGKSGNRRAQKFHDAPRWICWRPSGAAKP
jgi:hypothetical protein